MIISPRAPEELVEIGQGVGLDLAAAHSAGSLRLLRIPSAADLAARGPEGLAKSYRDLAGLVSSDQPGRVIIEDFTPLVQFDTFERFHDAFSDLVRELRDQGTTMLIGLGDPANDASRRLLDVVEKLVDGTVRLGSGGDLVLSTPGKTEYPSSDGSSREAIPPPPPQAFAPPEPVAPTPEAAVPAPAAPAPEYAPPAPSAPEPVLAVPQPPAPPAAPAPPTSGFQTTFSAPAEPTAPFSAPPPPMLEAAAAGEATAASPEMPPDLPFDLDLADETPGASGPGGLVETDIVAPPPADPSLLHAGTDPFGYDPADALLQQGYLADSGIGAPIVAQAPPPSATPSAMPSFAPLGGAPVSAPPADPNAGFRAALDASFAARATGTPFQVVALRMEPTSPAAAHFGAVEAGLRSALRPGDHVRVDAARTRAAVVLPASGPEAGQALFAGLQAHLRAHLGAQAESVLQSVSAVTISDGQPFQTAADLVAYAIEG